MRKLYIVILTVVFSLTLWSMPVLAQDPVQKELKLNEVVSLALQKSKSYAKAKLEVEKAELDRNNAADDVKYAPTTGDPLLTAAYEPGVQAVFYQFLNANLTWEMNKKSQTAEEDKLVLDTCKKYWDVQKAQADLKSKELAVVQKESALRRVQAMVRLGMSPPESATAGPELALTSSERDLATARMNLTTAQNTLNSDYETLNKQIGLMPNERPALVDEVVYEPLKVDSLEAAMRKAIENSPSIWLAEQKVNLADYANLFGYSGGSLVDSDIREINVEQSQLDAVSAKDAAELLTRGYYYQVKTYEDAIPASEKALKEAEEGYRVAKIYNELGMSTREDLQKSEAALADAKKKLLEAKASHAYYVMAFQKPWAA